ncbi:MAG: hypothetical protein U0Z75_08715 [Deinococcaceae bacterium]
MSCDVMFVGQFEHFAAPYERICELVQGLARSKQIGELVRVVLHDKERGGSPMLDLFASAQESKHLDLSLLDAHLSQLQGSDIAIEAFWEVMRSWPRSGLGEYRLTTTVVGSNFYWPPYSALSADLVLDVGSAKHFSPSICGDAACQNIESLFVELADVVRCGVQTLRGLDEDRSSEPETTFFCFHRMPSGFARDAGLVSELTLPDIQTAAIACEDLGVLSLECGTVVFHRRGMEGNLSGFYHHLKQRA